jgi:trans-aconitate 2-methyltransferase
VAQWGGVGNVARVVDALAAVANDFDGIAGWPGPWWFPSAEEVADQLSAAGFDVDGCWLHPEPVRLDSRVALEEYLATPVLVAHLARVAPKDRYRLIHAVADQIPDGCIDYIRVNVVARRYAR